MARSVALLDANVLYPARLRDLFLRLAIDGQFDARWSGRLLDECFDNLLTDRPDLSAAALERTRRLMAVALPEAMVEGFEDRIDSIELPDPDDRHVLAAALTAQVDVIVTANLKDFPAGALPTTMTAQAPDTFVGTLLDLDAEAVVAVIEVQAASLRNPPMTVEELLAGLAEVGLVESSRRVRELLR